MDGDATTVAAFGARQHLVQVNIARTTSPQSWMRENTLFARMFTVYAKCAPPPPPRRIALACV